MTSSFFSKIYLNEDEKKVFNEVLEKKLSDDDIILSFLEYFSY